MMYCCSPPSLSPGLTFSLNRVNIPNNNISRISVTDLAVSSSGYYALFCRAQYTAAQKDISVHLVADGHSPIISGSSLIFYGPPKRGWSTHSGGDGNGRYRYLYRQQTNSEEGYYSCVLFGDINPVIGVYILYHSESPSHYVVIPRHTHNLCLQSVQ